MAKNVFFFIEVKKTLSFFTCQVDIVSLYATEDRCGLVLMRSCVPGTGSGSKGLLLKPQTVRDPYTFGTASPGMSLREH